MLRLRTFGTIDLRGKDGERLGALLDQPKRFALLAFLAAHQRSGPVRREKLASVLWPDSSPTSARSALSTTLSRLRESLGDDVIRGRGGESIGLSGDHFTSDVAEFEDALADGRPGEAIDLYQGPFLEGLRSPDSRPFEEWVERRRTRYRERAYHAALDAAEQAAGESDRTVEAQLRRAMEIEPLREEAVERLVALFGDRGDVASAVRVFDRFRDRLDAELGVPPPESLRSRVRSLREGSREFRSGPKGRPADSAPEESAALPETEAAGSPPGLAEAEEGAPAGSRFRGYLSYLLVGLVLLVGAGWLLLGGGGPGEPGTRPAARDGRSPAPVAVVPFQVSGGAEETWRDGMVTLLTTALDGTPGIRPIADRTMLAAWETRDATGAGATRDEALSLARRLGARFAVVGSAVSMGGEIRLSAGVHEVRSGERLGHVEVRGVRDSVPVLADDLARRIIGLLVGRTASGAGAIETATVTTRSLDALEAYLAGERHYRRGAFGPAIENFRRAVERDTGFALAHWRLASSLSWSGREGIYRSLERAREMDSRLPARERRLLRAAWLLRYPGRPLAAVDTLRRLAEAYPDDPAVWSELGDAILHAGVPGGWPEADAAFARAVELDPGHEVYQIHHLQLAISFHHDSSLAARRLERLPESEGSRPWFHTGVALAFGSPARRQATLARLDSFPDVQDLPLGLAQMSLLHPLDGAAEAALLRQYRRDSLASLLIFQNLLRRGLLEDALASMRRMPRSSMVDCALAEAAGLGYPIPDSVLRGRLESSDSTGEPSMSRLLCRGVYLVDQGREPQVAEVLDRMQETAEQMPDDPPGRRTRAGHATDVLRGYRAWKNGDLERAARILSRSVYVDRPHMLVSSWRSLWRGDLHRDRGALREAEGWYLAAWWHPLAHERLGGLYEEMGEPVKAAASYRRFVAAWEDADEAMQGRVEETRDRIADLIR